MGAVEAEFEENAVNISSIENLNEDCFLKVFQYLPIVDTIRIDMKRKLLSITMSGALFNHLMVIFLSIICSCGIFMNLSALYMLKLRPLFDNYTKTYLSNICFCNIGMTIMDYMFFNAFSKARAVYYMYGLQAMKNERQNRESSVTKPSNMAMYSRAFFWFIGVNNFCKNIYNQFNIATLLLLTALSIHIFLHVYEEKEHMNCKFVTVMIVSIIWFFCIVYMILYMISFESTDAYEFKDSQILESRSLWYSYQHFTFALSALLMIMSLALIAIVQIKNYRNVVLGWTEDWEWRKKILPAIFWTLVTYFICSLARYVSIIGSLLSYCKLYETIIDSFNGSASPCRILKFMSCMQYFLIPFFILKVVCRAESLSIKLQRREEANQNNPVYIQNTTVL